MQNIIEKTSVTENIEQRDIEERFDMILGTNDFLLDRAVSTYFLFTYLLFKIQISIEKLFFFSLYYFIMTA